MFLSVVLVVASCGGGGETSDGSTTTAAGDPPATTAASAITEAPATTEAPTTLPPTTAAPTTTTQPGAEGTVPDPTAGATLVPYSDENITAGDVFLYWYREDGGNYVVIYAGPGIAGASGQALCPGNSIATPAFEFISNTPVEGGSCEGFTTDTASVQVCSGDVWIYRTAIPADSEGTLFGSLEWTAADGTIKGLTSQFETTNDIPTIEYGLGSYSLWEGFTSDGSTTITCSNPMP
jgi:hypothetical protein